jgi:Heterokaryon incompatibility protein (HET)
MSHIDSHAASQAEQGDIYEADGFQGLGNYNFRVARNLGFSFREPAPIKDHDGLSLGSSVEIQEFIRHSLQLSKTRLGAISTFEAREVADRISAINPMVATDLRLREEALSDMPFRLVKLRTIHASDRPAVFSKGDTYIALSYCCSLSPTPLGKPSTGGKPVVPLPVSDFMFKAVLSELKSTNEGIWIDTLSIHQDDEKEKRRLIGLMDVIYKNARLIVIILEDLVITEDEVDLLEFFIDISQRGEVWDMKVQHTAALHTTRFLWKLFSARWFTRAWCNHEFRLSHNHVFYARVDSGSSAPSKVLRFTSKFLGNLREVDSSYSTYKEPTDKIYWERRKAFRGIANAFLMQGSLINPSYKIQVGIRDPITSFMTIFEEVFSLDSTLARDKLAISLNVADCGLSFEGPAETRDDCCLVLSLIALAARDPTVLCNSGKMLEIPGKNKTTTWLRMPSSRDAQGTYGDIMIHRRLDHVPPFTQETVTLDLLLLGEQTALHYAREPFITQAAWFVDGSIATASRKGYWLDTNWRPGSPINKSKRLYFVRALACALECGRDWFNRSINSKRSIGSKFLEGFAAFLDPGAHTHSFKSRCDWFEAHYKERFEFFEQYIDDVVNESLPSIREPDWLPAWISTGRGPLDKSLTLCPPVQGFTLAIPALLKHKDYINFSRIFILERLSPGNESDTWRLLGKTASFGTGDFSALEESGCLLKGQVIRGA